MLKKVVYALCLTPVFYVVVLVSESLGLHAYPETTFQLIGPLVTFLTLFGTVNNVMQGAGG